MKSLIFLNCRAKVCTLSLAMVTKAKAMKVSEILLELMVTDVDASVQFYRQVLGFTVVASEQNEAGATYWAKMQLQHFIISFKEEQRLKNEEESFQGLPVGGSMAICFQVEDLEAYHGQVQHQCRLLNHPHLTPCGATQFSMRDNSGYIIIIERF